MAVCGALTLTATACTGGGGNSRGSQSHATAIARTSSPAVQRPQASSLVLAAGRSSARYRITAPSPAQYAFTVTVAAPASVDVAVNISTWYGALLSILGSTHQPGSCRPQGTQDLCFERFPFLPAQLAGTWTVIASKQRGPAATVRVAVTFARP
jgi:hypothetical protein